MCKHPTEQTWAISLWISPAEWRAISRTKNISHFQFACDRVEHFVTFSCALPILTMDFFHVFIIIFELMICTMYFARYQVNGAQLPVDQEHVDQLVANGNSDSVTISNQKQIGKDHAVSTDVVARDNDTVEWYDQNVVTSDNNLTTQAVTNDNNVSVTTDVATETIPALQQYHHHDNDYIKFHQPDNLKPRAGLDLQNNQQDILLQHSKSVEEFTSSDFAIKGHDITTPDPDDTTVLGEDTYQDSQINNRDYQSEYSTSDYVSSITDLLLKSTTTRAVPVSSGDDNGSFLNPATTATTYLSSVQLEHGNTLGGSTKQNPNPSSQNTQSEFPVVIPTSHTTTSQPSLFITLLLSSSASPSFEEENQANSSPGYSTHGQHEEVSTTRVADVFTSLDKHTVTKRETSSTWDAVSYVTTAPSGEEGYLTTLKSETFVPPETPDHVTTLTNHKLDDDTSGTVISSSSGNGDIIDYGLQGQGQTKAPVQGQPLTTLTYKTSQVEGVPRTATTTTTMVYIASSDVTDNGNNLFDGFDGLDGKSDFKVKDIILGVCGTVGCMLTVCMLVAFTRCCCKKQKDDEEEETGGATSGTLKALRSLGRKSKHRGSKSDATTPSGGGGRESATDVTQVTLSVVNTKEQTKF